MIQQRRRRPNPVQPPVAEAARSKIWPRANADEEAEASWSRRAGEMQGGGASHSLASADVVGRVDPCDKRGAQQVLLQRDRLLLEFELARQARTLHHDEESRGHLEEARTILAGLQAQREL